MAIVNKYAVGTSVRINKIIKRINTKRNRNNPNASNYIDSNTFTKNYGAANAKKAVDDGINRKPASKRAIRK